MANLNIYNWNSINSWYLLKNSDIIKRFNNILSFNDFWVLQECGWSTQYANYLLKSINIKDDSSTNNINYFSDHFEWIKFIREWYSFKTITLEMYLKSWNWKSINDLVEEIKDNFSEIKWILKYKYRWKIMEIEVVKNYLTFSLTWKIKTFSIWWKAQPFFKDTLEINRTWIILNNFWIIVEDNKWQRADVILEIEPISVNWWVKIWNLKIEKELLAWDKIKANFQTWKVFINWNFTESIWSLPLLKNINIPIKFLDKISYPVLSQEYSSLDLFLWLLYYYVDFSNYYWRVIKHYFPTHNITNLKEIEIWFNNSFNASVNFFVTIYSGNSQAWTQLYTWKQTFYAWENYSDIPFIIDWNGIDLTLHTDLFFVISIFPIWIVWTNDNIWAWKRTVNWEIWNWISYDSDDIAVDWTWSIKMKWLSLAYTPIIENTNSFTYKLDYFNKFI